MSNARKLQTEIDRVLKKVDEGVELFDEIWEKVYSAEQQSQKEKHEQDLKKEIKKLQRLRDQIKTWIGSSEVKDKDALLEARRLIETKMEQFKVCEKETKTKTYSKEGLAREEKLDPLEEAKRNTSGWITDYIERLRQLVQDREVEIERLQAGKGKKSNKHIIDEYQSFLLNHKFHVSKLEGIMRLVNNDRLDPELVDNIKDDLDYYMDSYEEDEYQQAYDENFFYESLGLDELDVVVVDRVTVAPPAVKKASNDDSGSQASSNMSNSKDTSNNKKSNKKTPAATVIPLTIGRARVSSAGEVVKPGIPTTIPMTIGGPAGVSTPPSMISTPSAPVLQATSSASAASSPTIVPTGGASATTTPTKLGRASTTGGAVPSSAAAAIAAPSAAALAPTVVPPSTAGRTTPTPNATGGASMAAILKRETEQQEKERQKVLQQQLHQQQQLLREQQARAAQAAEQLRQQQQQAQQLAQRQQQEAQQQLQRQQQQQQEALRQQKAAAAAAAAQQEALQRQQQQQQEQALRQQQQEAAAKQQAQLQQQVAEKLQQQQQQQQQQQPRSQAVGLDILASGLGGLSLGNTERGETAGVAATSAVNPNVPPPLAASAPAPTAVTGTSLGTSGSYDAASSYLAALNESLATIPNAAESERSRPYTPSNPYPTPACYPSLPSSMFDNPAVFEKLGTDCLFFIFYYAQGTYQQYLAARELKKQSWRFHKKFMTWFQRHEEPKVTTDEYEQGTYVYFDYESGWCTRIKSDFRFEYIYLEDSLQ